MTPFPADLPSELPDPSAPWMMSSTLTNKLSKTNIIDQAYRKCIVEPTDPEARLVIRYFLKDAPGKYGIKKITCIHNGTQTRAFEDQLTTMHSETTSKAFEPGWRKQDDAPQREKVHRLWKAIKDTFPSPRRNNRVESYSDVAVLPL